jgi:hypothetical protein
VFCGRHLLAAKLRPASIDAADGAVEEVARIRRWPHARILLRADSGFVKEELMAWCEANAVHFLFGLAQNERLVANIAAELVRAEVRNWRTGKPARSSRNSRGGRGWSAGPARHMLPSPSLGLHLIRARGRLQVFEVVKLPASNLYRFIF